MIKTILWDIDGTLLDFVASEKYALRKTFRAFGFELSDEDIVVYSEINDSYWTKFDKGEVTKAEVYELRFRDFFIKLGTKEEELPDTAAINDMYQVALGEVFFFHDGAEKLVKDLKDDGYRQYIVTNGSTVAQQSKLKLSGLGELCDGVFISELMGLQKPDKAYFDKCFEAIPNFKREEAIIIGDSLTSDIKGGNNAGIMTCWFNPGGKTNTAGVTINYEIRSLVEVYDILEYNKQETLAKG